MLTSRLLAALLPALLLLPAAAPAAGLDKKPPLLTIHSTAKPGGPFGYWGPDISTTQKVAARFTMPAGGNMQLARIALHMMNNSDTEHSPVTLRLQTDALDDGGTESLPSGNDMEIWTIPVEALGWNPVQQAVLSVLGPQLTAGKNYWVVAESAAPPGLNPVWLFASRGTGFSTTSVDGVWQTAGSGAALTLGVEGTAMGSGVLPDVSMSLESYTIRVGERTLMSWSTRRARKCYAFGAWSGQWPTEDSVYVYGNAPGTLAFQMTCTNASGRGGSQVLLTVLPAQ